MAKKTFFNPLKDKSIFEPKNRGLLVSRIKTKYRYKQDKRYHTIKLLLSDKKGDYAKFNFTLDDVDRKEFGFKINDIVYKTDKKGVKWFYLIVYYPVFAKEYIRKDRDPMNAVKKSGNRYYVIDLNTNEGKGKSEYMYLDTKVFKKSRLRTIQSAYKEHVRSKTTVK